MHSSLAVVIGLALWAVASQGQEIRPREGHDVTLKLGEAANLSGELVAVRASGLVVGLRGGGSKEVSRASIREIKVSHPRNMLASACVGALIGVLCGASASGVIGGDSGTWENGGRTVRWALGIGVLGLAAGVIYGSGQDTDIHLAGDEVRDLERLRPYSRAPSTEPDTSVLPAPASR